MKAKRVCISGRQPIRTNYRVSVVIHNDPSRSGTSFGGGGDDRKRPWRHAPGRAHQKEVLQLPPKRQKIHPVAAQKGRRKQPERRIDDDDDKSDKSVVILGARLKPKSGKMTLP